MQEATPNESVWVKKQIILRLTSASEKWLQDSIVPCKYFCNSAQLTIHFRQVLMVSTAPRITERWAYVATKIPSAWLGYTSSSQTDSPQLTSGWSRIALPIFLQPLPSQLHPEPTDQLVLDASTDPPLQIRPQQSAFHIYRKQASMPVIRY